ncbi:MAG: hypothetical protein A2077_06875 [Nitrospirae bacterium GWC2_46_6]|nr:MAG: hypothetical protein A2077_06875 [Nitrospirae bacterium GWC2_46_6]OGW20937.1 MAG: hypothetical protein A2Z82_12160 [Nitrospirae bacterium GWA2_46_11]OGW23021.1 MAG: hypothetical protein A2X55_12680 [Nitrospirae bacterium GWB2_47_37]HAK88365.1 hypothetical protein [Nitrospiraceae bacterium]HCL81828.1 hypothetical protein [Nitrospiraceae bacterium]
MRNPLALLLIAVVFISAWLWINRAPALKFRPVKGYLDMISLSSDQKQRVDAVRKDFFPKLDGIRQKLRIKRLQLNDLIFSSKPDMKTIEDKTREIASLQTELEKEVVNHILQEKEILMPEQNKQFYMIIKKEFEKDGLWMHGVRKAQK